MSGEYRDPLEAAHARIAELEEKIRALEEEARPTNLIPKTGQFPELERKVELLRGPADEVASGKRRAKLTWFGAIFPLIGMILSFLHLPIAATVSAVFFIVLTIVNLSLQLGLKKAKVRYADANRELANARRIWELEAKLAEQSNVRVAAQPDASPFATETEVEELSSTVAARG